MNASSKDTLINPKKLTFLALMLAITIIFDLTPLGAIPLGPISATILHIPTVITGIILGPVAGFIMGTLLGIISLLHALTRPVTVLDPLFINPLVSVLPRMFIGLVSYYVYKALNKITNTGLASLIAGAIGSITNTVLVFLMLYIVYAQRIVKELGMGFKALLSSVVITNAIAEALVSAIITSAIFLAYKKYRKVK